MMEELREEAERQKIADEKRKAQRLAIEEENRKKREFEEKKKIDRVIYPSRFDHRKIN
jgi:hypothetical protein